MSAETNHHGACPVPFLDESTFPSDDGNIAGRLCTVAGPGLRCCLPCPSTDWIYTQALKRYFKVAGVISAVGLVLTLFILLSWAVLPPEKTKRHAFGLSLSSGIICICLAITVGAGVNPQQCANEITPNDLHSSTTCALTGIFVVAGAVIVTTWAWIRALVMHLQVCWDVKPNMWFTVATQVVGWSITITIFVSNMIVTGVSYRFGPTCHINSKHALTHYWLPLFVLAGMAGLLTMITVIYCLYIYLTYYRIESFIENRSIRIRTSTTSSTSTRQIYRRITKVLWLNWRSIVIIACVLLDVAFYSAVYVKVDRITIAATDGSPGGLKRVMPFIVCLIEHQGDRTKCFDEAGKALVTEDTALAVLMLLSLAGIQCFALLVRSGLYSGWKDLMKHPFNPVNESGSISNAISRPTSGLRSKSQPTDPECGTLNIKKLELPLGITRPTSSSNDSSAASTGSPAPPYHAHRDFATDLTMQIASFAWSAESNDPEKTETGLKQPVTPDRRPSANSGESTAEVGEAKVVTVTRVSQDTIWETPFTSPRRISTMSKPAVDTSPVN